MGLVFKMIKKKATQKQLHNLAKGRERLFQNQLKQRGFNSFPTQPVIRERQIIMQPVNQNVTHHHSNTNINLSLFDKFIETKLFTINKNNQKEIVNLREIINYLIVQLNQQNNQIIKNENKIDEIINYLSFKEKEYSEKFCQLEEKITNLENENKKLKDSDSEKDKCD